MSVEEHNPISGETKKWLDLLYEGIYVVNREKIIVYWNKGAEHITGYNPEEMTGKQCGEDTMNHQDYFGHNLCREGCPLEKALKGQTTESKLFPKHKKGHRIPIAAFMTPLKNEEGAIIGAIEIFREVSAEEEIRHLKEKYKKAIRQYVSETTYKQVIRSLNQESYTFVGHNRDLTILFMDIVGFTGLSEKLEPEKVVEMLNAYFSLTSLIIQQNQGDIDKFLGDGVMAVFENAEHAIQAAIDMINPGLKKLNHNLRAIELPEINIRIGINSGNLIQGNIGSEERKDWTVVGDVVNTAYRIEESAEPDTIRISEDTLKRLKNPEQCVFVKKMTLKGKSNPIKVYTIASYKTTGGSHKTL
ncbi:MAG: PAS domain-containing protein [Bacteroidales bacterium]|nr:PAS domain-containing protein [Bacteroidales bacterium]